MPNIYGRTITEQSGVLLDDSGVARTITRTPVDVSLVNDTDLVPAQGAGLKIRVLALKYRSGAAVNVRFKSGPGSNLSASFSLGINDEVDWQYNPQGWFETNANQAFVVNQSLAVASGAQVVWIVVA